MQVQVAIGSGDAGDGSLQMLAQDTDLVGVQIWGPQGVVRGKHGVALDGGAQILLGTVFNVEQPLGEAVMEQHQRASARNRDHSAEKVETAIEVVEGDAGAGRLHAFEEDLRGDGQLGGQDHVQQRLNFGELLPAEEPLAQPQVEAVQGAWYLADLSQDDEVLGHPVENLLQVQKTAVALDVQLVQHLGRVVRDVLPDGNREQFVYVYFKFEFKNVLPLEDEIGVEGHSRDRILYSKEQESRKDYLRASS